jgi:hypothetical protein
VKIITHHTDSKIAIVEQTKEREKTDQVYGELGGRTQGDGHGENTKRARTDSKRIVPRTIHARSKTADAHVLRGGRVR